MCLGACAQRGGGRGCGASCPSCQRRSSPSPDTLPPWPPGTPCTPSAAGSVPTCAPAQAYARAPAYALAPACAHTTAVAPRRCLVWGTSLVTTAGHCASSFNSCSSRLTRTFFGKRSSCVWSSRCEQQGEWQDTIALPACCRCGCPTESVEAGAKRQCTGEGRHRVYPRTDPVVRLLPST